MDQDDLEETVLYQSLLTHLELIRKILIFHPSVSGFLRPEIIFVIVFLAFIQGGRWVLQRSLLGGESMFGRGEADISWGDSQGRIFIHAAQGQRPSMEDRFLSFDVFDPGEAERSLKINAVLDGHGGEFAADYVRSYLVEELARKLRGLLILTNFKKSKDNLGTKGAVQLLEKCQKCRLSRDALELIGVSETDYKKMSSILDDKETSDTTMSNTNGNDDVKTPLTTSEEPPSFGSSCKSNLKKRSNSPSLKTTRTKRIAPPPPLKISNNNSSPVLTERVKNISSSSPDDLTPNQLSVNTSFTTPSRKSNSSAGSKKTKIKPKEISLMEYLSANNSILYPKLLRKEINIVDGHLIEKSKEKCSYSGTTLILSILDASYLWVANVGDSRGVLCSERGSAIPLSYDHKPSQLKEKKRIEEAGGFVSMNGVWRVQGILATSRALGDYPLKDKNLIVCDPDILSFSLQEHKPRFMVLASDGLWDTHSNEEALKLISKYSTGFGGIKIGLKNLCAEAMERGSMDNITILVHKF